MLGSNYLGQSYFGQGYAERSIVFDSASNSGYKVSLSSYSWSHIAGLSKRGLLVNVSLFATGSVTGITYNGVAMTFVRADTIGVYRNEIWRLENPAYGSNTIAVTLSASLTSIASASSYGNVDQVSMVDASAGATGSGISTPSVNISTISNFAWIVDGLTTSNGSMTPNTAQTQRDNNTGALGTGAMSDKGPITNPSSTSMSWSAVGALDSWALSVVALDPFEDNILGTSTSTSSTSSSTSSTSSSTSTTSTSTSISTSSTSSSTSSTSSSTSHSTSSTSSSISTSSTSSSTSISTSSTSTSHSTSSTSSSISTSSTSASTSTSQSTSTTNSITTSTSSTSSSLSTSTSQSTSTSISTSSTSFSTSTSLSTSSTSTSLSTSTSSTSTSISTSISTSSTSISSSTSTTISTTTSTSSTSSSTSSTSMSTSTSTTLPPDINFIPRSIIIPENRSSNIESNLPSAKAIRDTHNSNISERPPTSITQNHPPSSSINKYR